MIDAVTPTIAKVDSVIVKFSILIMKKIIIFKSIR